MSLISLTNLITWLENHILITNKAEKKNQQWFNAKDECLSILWKYILTIFLKHLNNLIY
jgi:hypothetical protein